MAASAPRLLAVLEEGASAEVVEEFAALVPEAGGNYFVDAGESGGAGKLLHWPLLLRASSGGWGASMRHPATAQQIHLEGERLLARAPRQSTCIGAARVPPERDGSAVKNDLASRPLQWLSLSWTTGRC